MKKRFILLAIVITILSLIGCGEKIGDSTEVPEGRFSIVSPTNEQTEVAVCPEIEWTSEKNATKYLVEIILNNETERTEQTSELRIVISNPLAYDTEYLLKITALKESDGKDVALSYTSSKFTTVKEHNTDAPDYTQPRTIYDFDDMTSDQMNEMFEKHAAGDDVQLSLVDEGKDNTKALKISYDKGVNGWSGITNSLPAEKKVWSGAKGIKFYVKGCADGSEIEVRFGKRGYQSWSACFKVNNDKEHIISIPFDSFEDAGGGDGIMDLSGITRLWFFFKGSNSGYIIIDDISIGSDDTYSTDTRNLIEKSEKVSAQMVDDFEDNSTKDTWVVENISSVALNSLRPLVDLQSISVTPTGAWATFGKNLPYLDFSDIQSISFNATKGKYVVQLISDFNVIEKEIECRVDGELIGVNLGDLKPQSSSHTYNIKNISCFRIGIKDKTGTEVLFDNISFNDKEFVPTDYNARVIENFENDFVFEERFTSLNEFQNEVIDVEGNKVLKLTGADSIGLEVNNLDLYLFGDTVGFKMDVTSTGPLMIDASIGSWMNVYQINKKYSGVQTFKFIMNYDEMTLKANSEGELNKENINFMQLWFTSRNNTTITIDNLEFYNEENRVDDTYSESLGLVIEDFESEDFTTDKFDLLPSNSTIQADGDNKYLKLLCNNPCGIQIADKYNLWLHDFSNAKGFKIDFKVNQSVKYLEIKLGSYGNLYEYKREIYGATNNITQIVIPFESMTLADGSNGALDLSKLNFIQLWFTCYGDYTVCIDNIALFDDSFKPESVLLDDFNNYSSDSDLQAKWNASNVTLNDNQMSINTVSGWNGLQLNLCTGVGEIGGAEDFQNCYAIQLDIISDVDFALCVKVTRWSTSIEKSIQVSSGKNTVTVYLNSLTGEEPLSDMIFNSLTLGVTYYGATSILIDNVTMLKG